MFQCSPVWWLYIVVFGMGLWFNLWVRSADISSELLVGVHSTNREARLPSTLLGSFRKSICGCISNPAGNMLRRLGGKVQAT